MTGAESALEILKCLIRFPASSEHPTTYIVWLCLCFRSKHPGNDDWLHTGNGDPASCIISHYSVTSANRMNISSPSIKGSWIWSKIEIKTKDHSVQTVRKYRKNGAASTIITASVKSKALYCCSFQVAISHLSLSETVYLSERYTIINMQYLVSVVHGN